METVNFYFQVCKFIYCIFIEVKYKKLLLNPENRTLLPINKSILRDLCSVYYSHLTVFLTNNPDPPELFSTLNNCREKGNLTLLDVWMSIFWDI